MPSISSAGIGSGLDVKAIVEALVKAEITPNKNRLDRQEASLSTQLSALGQVNSALAKLQATMLKFSDLSQFQTLTTTISNTTALGASVNNSEAIAGNYQIQIQQLATQQSLASAPFPSSTSTVGSGTITINFGSYSNNNTVFTANPNQPPLTLNIIPGQDSLLAIQDAINSSASGVQAAIVQDNSGTRLTLMSTNTGTASAMQISVVDNDGNNSDLSGLSALAYDPTQGVNSLSQTIAANDSLVYINGLLLTQSSNQLQNAIQGVTLNLLQAQPGVTVNMTVANNPAQTTAIVNEFIQQYNDTMTTLNSLTSYNKETKKGSSLQSDAGIRALKFNLANLVSRPIDNLQGPIKSLVDFGIKTDLKGLLSMDSDLYNNALASYPQAIGNFFAKSATATDPNIHVKSLGIDVQAGLYDLVINSFIPGNTLTGTLGGVNAVSPDGITLEGTGPFGELRLEVLGGGVGDRGYINITDGLAVQFTNLLSTYLGDEGDLSARTELIKDSLKDIDQQREQLGFRAISLATRYTKQFTALDTLLSRMQSTSQFLTQQLANLPQINQKRN
ncbi:MULTISPECIES: flagellar filament capping protein FliD [Legionella]|uniref:Flagellar hook-associated protein 2 n=1 Tax=Legionella drozanskii LLAP-1 TaxID=1212489 RepID=A0A0W0T0W9_9GAMM|nr:MULTISPECIES: flagellar filament capping protein FliD [Legionella]KTC89210.1 flagellar hook associated protein 2 FliD [Legionella drozanskii LLAP-1]PJE13362.1 MAG: flagellar hook protein FliD [Legionella sp.]